MTVPFLASLTFGRFARLAKLPLHPLLQRSSPPIFLGVMGDAIYHRTYLGDSLLHALQKLCIAGELEAAEARRIIADFNEVMAEELRSPENSGPPTTKLKGKVTRFNFANMPRNSANATWTGQGGPTWFLYLADASFTIRGNTTPLKGVTQLGIRQSIEGKAPVVAPGGQTGSSGGHRTSGDIKLGPGGVKGKEDRSGKGLRQPMKKEQERLKRKRAKEGAKHDKGLYGDMGGVARGGNGSADQRKRQRSGKMSSEMVVKSDDDASKDSLGDLDELDDLDDLEKELDDMDDDDDESIKTEMSPIGKRKGQEADSSSEEGEAEEEYDPDSAESGGSVVAATLEIERFLESFEGNGDEGTAQTVKERKFAAEGAENPGTETDVKSRGGANDQALEDGHTSDCDNSTLQQGTIRPVHDEVGPRKANNDRKYLGNEAAEGGGAHGGKDHPNRNERQGEGRTSPVTPKHLGASGYCSQKEEKVGEIEEDVDSDLERDFDDMLDEGDGLSDPESEPENAKRKGDGEALVEKRGDMFFDEELEDVSSYSEGKSDNEDAIEDIEGFLAQI